MNEKMNNSNTPIVHLSTLGLDLKVEEGDSLKGSLILESENGIPIRGKILSTSDKMSLDTEEFEGKRKEFRYTFDGSMALDGESYSGDFIFITNGGEFNLPFMVEITPKTIRTNEESISNMNDFKTVYGKNRDSAKEIFFHPNFSQIGRAHV